MTQETLVLGGGPIGLELATELAVQKQSVAFVDGEPNFIAVEESTPADRATETDERVRLEE